MTEQTRRIRIKPKVAVAALPPDPISRRRTYFKKIDIKRAVMAAKEAGIDVAAIELSPDGKIRLTTLASHQLGGPSDLFSKWEGRL